MLPVLVLVACLLWGFALLRVCRVVLSAEERWVAAPLVGLVTGFWLIYLVAALTGSIRYGMLVFGAAALGGTVLAVRWFPAAPPGLPQGWFLSLGVGLGIALGAMNVHGVLARSATGTVVAAEHVWADTPFHAAIITSFAHGDNFPPRNPVALSQPLDYPFLVDFASAVLMGAGFSLRASIIVINVLVQLVFFLGVALIAHRLTGSARPAVLAALLTFCLGNLGWLAIPADVAAAGGIGDWLRDLPWSYTGDALGEPGRERLGVGVYLGNPTFIYFLPRRAAALGLATGAVLLLLIDRLLDNRHVGTAVLVGVLLGLLPLVHAHTGIAMLVFLAAWFVLLPWRNPREARSLFGTWRQAAGVWLLAGGVAVAIALPWLVQLAGHAPSFFAWWPGWTGEPREAFRELGGARGLEALGAAAGAAWDLTRFWAVNGGLLVPLALVALIRSPRRIWYWYLPFALLWVLGNVLRTQPWEWDNNNYFVYWQFGSAVIVATWLAPHLFPAPGSGRIPPGLRRAAACLCVAGLTLGGLLSFAFAAQQRHHLWTPAELDFAAAVRERTPADAVILTSNDHGHPVLTLSGRQGYSGFTGWLSTHGIDPTPYERGLERMYRGDVALMRGLGIDHVVVGPRERGMAAHRGFELSAALSDPDLFRLVHAGLVDGQRWELRRLREPPDRS